MTALGSGLLGALVAGSIVSSGQGRTHELPTDAMSLPAGGALVNGINVNFRTGPGLTFPVAARLNPGERLALHEERDGWFAAITTSGTRGWVFGAFLAGIGTNNHGAAVVRRTLSSDDQGLLVTLQPGDKVYFVRNRGGRTEVILPTGQRLRVAPEYLARVD